MPVHDDDLMMTSRNFRRLPVRWLLALCAGLLLLIPSTARAQSGEAPRLAVIVSPQGASAELSAADFRKLVTGEKQRWPSGTKVAIALMKTTNPVGEATARQVYKMSGNELNKYWLALVFQGRAKAPQFFTSEAELAAFVRDTPGAIGVLSQPASVGSKAAAVDGKDTL
jgi:mRNA-degrading endonuclease toxin of MazEF toxin-antitoxin module